MCDKDTFYATPSGMYALTLEVGNKAPNPRCLLSFFGTHARTVCETWNIEPTM